MDGNGGAQYEVIIVGGRPAGATLAARLGQQGVRTLLVERATLPSLPAVSSPAIYSSTMKLLDEIGADEREYARNTPPIRRWITEIRDDFHTVNRVPDLWGRDYGYAVDRARFDEALWRHAARFPSVTVRDGFAVTDLLRDGERVTGLIGRAAGGAEERIAAGCVVGADGRFSLVARKAGATVHDEHTAQPTTLLYAYWRNARPYDGDGAVVHVFAPGNGMGFLLMDSADDTLAVVIEAQAALLEPQAGESVEGVYERLVRAYPRVAWRVAGAERIGEVRGMKRVGNLYRQAGGPGWALVGDALHQKDPLDGQGIFDAVFTAKALAESIDARRRGEQSWAQAVADYEVAVRAETFPMYKTTLERVRRDIYEARPEWAWNTLIRWIATDPEYMRRLGLLLVRGIPPEGWLPASVTWRAMARGALGDLRRSMAASVRRRSRAGV